MSAQKMSVSAKFLRIVRKFLRTKKFFEDIREFAVHLLILNIYFIPIWRCWNLPEVPPQWGCNCTCFIKLLPVPPPATPVLELEQQHRATDGVDTIIGEDFFKRII